MSPVVFLVVSLTAFSAVGWIVGESQNKPLMRRVCGPACAILVVLLSVGLTVVRTSFGDAIRYSRATKDFVGALVAAIDRGDVEAAHEALRDFDAESIETYEGGALLRWLREPVETLGDQPKEGN